jgi:hypothetical protein
MMCRTIVCLFFALCISMIATAEEKPDAKKLLKTYQQTVESLKQFGIEAVERNYERTLDPTKKGPQTHQFEVSFHSDGARWRIARTGGPVTDPKRGALEREILVGREVIISSRIPTDPNRQLWVLAWLDIDKGKIRAQHEWGVGMVLFGVCAWDNDLPIWKVMLDAPQLQLEGKPEVIDGAATYKVTSEGPLGIHSCWLDPKAGCLPRRIEIKKTKERGLPEPQPPSAIMLKRQPNLRNLPVRLKYTVRLEKIILDVAGKTPVMMGFEEVGTSELSDGMVSTRRTEFRVNKFHVNQNDWPENALAQQIPIPNGTPIQVLDALPGVQYVWDKGEIVKAE